MKVGIIGGGMVGRATALALKGHVEEVRVHDVKPERHTHTITEVLDCNIIFLCLPTPQKKGSLECDLRHIRNFFAQVTHYRGDDSNFVLRSTVPVGATESLVREYKLSNLVHSPEFLSVNTSLIDAQMPTRLIIGEPKGCGACGGVLFELYHKRWPHVPIHFMSSCESETLKLFDNAFGAVKVSLFNEFHSLADKLGLSWDAILNGMLAGGRIHPLYTQVPGHTGFGWNSHCWNKDTANLADCFEKMGLDATVLRAARARNEKDREQ